LRKDCRLRRLIGGPASSICIICYLAVTQAETSSDLDALWNFNDPGESEVKFRTFLEQPLAGPVRAETLTQLARSLGMQAKFNEAAEILAQAESLAVSGRPKVRLLLERGRVLNSSGHPQDARPLFVEAWDLARSVGEDGFAVDAAHMIAIVEDMDGQIQWNERAMELARSSPDLSAQKWMASLLNNLAWTYHDRGEPERALTMFEEAQRLRVEEANPIRERIARWCVARCLRTLGRTQEALVMQRRLLEEEPENKDGYAEEEMGECLLELGREDECRPFFASALAKFKENGALENDPDRLQRIESLALSQLGD
jgi:tetratricopeptide (TPR) repeat protein